MKPMLGPRLAIALLIVGFFCFENRVPAQEKSAGGAVSSGAAVLAYREAANFQNNGALEVAAEEWQKFLKDHANDPLAAKAQHYLGVCQLQLKDYGAAATAFAAVIKKYPKFEMLEDALFHLGTCQYAVARTGKPEQYAEAAKSFAALYDQFPASKHGEEAVFYRGEALYAAERKGEAAKAYELLVKQFPNSKRRAEALYAWGVTEEELENHASAVARYEEYLKEYGQQTQAADVKLRLAESMLKAGDAARAAELFGQLAADANNAAADRALYRQAFCFVKLEKEADAAAAFANLAGKYPKSKYAADATLSAGRLFYRTGKLDEAQKWLEKSAKEENDAAAEAGHWLCRILLKRGKPLEAAALAAKQLEKNGTAPFAVNLRLDRADALYEVPEQRREALTQYAKLADEQPGHVLGPQARYGAAFTALKLSKYEEGLAQAKKFLEVYRQSELKADVQYVAAECNLQLKKYDEAQAAYTQLATENSGHGDADLWRVRAGLASYLKKDYGGTVKALSPLVKDLKSAEARAEANFLVGASHFFENRFAEAKQSLAKSVEGSAKWRQADESLLLLARAEAKAGQFDAARDTSKRLLKEHPTSKLLDEAHYRLGEFQAALGDKGAAKSEYEFVATKFKDSPLAPYALLGKGWVEYKEQEFAAGEKTFSVFVSRFAEHPLASDAHYGRALCRRQTSDFAGAVADLDVVLKSNLEPARRADALLERGLAQVGKRDFSGAVESLEGFLKANPRHAAADQALYEIGWAWKAQENEETAAKAFGRLGEQFPRSSLAAEAWFHVAEERYGKKELAAAKDAYQKCRSAKPGDELDEKATYKLAWAEYQSADLAAALTHFDEQLKRHPRGALAADARFMKAECLFKQEKYAEAGEAYQAALQTKPPSSTAQAMLLLHAGQAAAQLKEWERSSKLLTQLIEELPESPLLAEAEYELGWAKQNSNDTGGALQQFDLAANRSKSHVGARARFMRGELLFAEKKYDEASKEFQRAMYGYGGEEASAETKNWQAKSGYEAGRCAEVQIASTREAAMKQRLVADAERCYRFVVEKHSSHELAEIAKKRLAALGKL
jgi:TolA-binding protein